MDCVKQIDSAQQLMDRPTIIFAQKPIPPNNSSNPILKYFGKINMLNHYNLMIWNLHQRKVKIVFKKKNEVEMRREIHMFSCDNHPIF